MVRGGNALGRLFAAATFCACSVFVPDVGPLQNDGAAPSTCSLGMSGYGTAYGAPAGQTATVDFCTADGGTIEGACDMCEVASCCTQRVACYSDQGCSCADQALDACLPASPSLEAGALDGGEQDAAPNSACWQTFAATGPIAQSRYACLRSACLQACQIPD